MLFVFVIFFRNRKMSGGLLLDIPFSRDFMGTGKK